MQTRVSDLRLRYKEINELFKRNLPKIKNYKKVTKFPKTIKVLIRFDSKIEFIKEGLIQANSLNNNYLSNILLRVLIEHLLVAHYIWTKNRIEKSDKVAECYYLEYSISEYLKQINYSLSVENIKNNLPKKVTFNNVKEKYPGLEEMTQEQLVEVNIIANQFDIRNIGNYLVNECPKEDIFMEIHVVMLKFLDMYNRLSSYIHAGPYAEYELYENSDNVKTKIQIRENSDWAFTAARLIKEFIFLSLGQEMKELQPAVMELGKIFMRQVQSDAKKPMPFSD